MNFLLKFWRHPILLLSQAKLLGNRGKNEFEVKPTSAYQANYYFGSVTHFSLKNNLEDKEPVFLQQLKIPKAHQPFLKEHVTKWLELFNAPNCSTTVLSSVSTRKMEVSELFKISENSTKHKYEWKKLTNAMEKFFTTLDLSSGFWKIPFGAASPPAKAFTIPGLRQFEWVNMPMGLLGCLASFQRLIKMIFRKLKNAYISVSQSPVLGP